MFNWLFQYILGYCTWWGLEAIGEPPLTRSLPPDCRVHDGFLSVGTSQARNASKEPMPPWVILIFMALVPVRYISSFLVSFFYFFLFFSREEE